MRCVYCALRSHHVTIYAYIKYFFSDDSITLTVSSAHSRTELYKVTPLQAWL
jgi:hypothetical protein